MRIRSEILLSVIMLLNSASLFAQDTLTFEEALEKTLEYNYDIRMARLDEQVAANNARLSSNGYLPSVTGSGGYDWTYYGGNNKLSSGEVPYDAATSYNYNASATVSYTIFDGMGRRFDYRRLQEAKALSELQARMLIEGTIVDLSAYYCEALRLQESVANIKGSVMISQDRSRRAKYAYEYGQSTKLDILNAQVDLNVDSIELVNAELQLSTARRNLNLIMGSDLNTDLILSGLIQPDTGISETEAINAAKTNNVQLHIADRNILSSEYAIGSTKADWLPKLSVDAGYRYNGSDNPNGAFLLGSRSNGPTAGVNLNWNLFDGSVNNRVHNAKIDLENARIQQEFTEQNVELSILNAHGQYTNSIFVWRTQEDNVATAERNFETSKESFRLGQITSIEYRQAQMNLLNAKQSLSKAKYDAKNAEMSVRSLMGNLLN